MIKDEKEVKAIDLMILDLETRHSEIRVEAKELHCEDELDFLKDFLLEVLVRMRLNRISDGGLE